MKSLFAAWVLVTVAALAGCSSSDSTAKTGASSGGPAVITDGGVATSSLDIPIPEGLWTKTTNIAHYKVYATRDDAITWFNGAKGENASIATDVAVPSSDARYADVDQEVAQIWAGFQQVFARDTQDLPAPIVILTDPASKLPGAYAVYDGALGLSPNVFMIQTPTLPLGQVALRGVIAHELTHHVLKHKWPGIEDQIERWYDATKTLKSGLGFDQTNDDEVAKIGLNYVNIALGTGDEPVTQWNGWDRPDSAIDYYRQLIHTKAAATSAAPCTDSDTSRNALITFADPLRDQATGEFVASTAQLAQLDTLTKDAVVKETTCATAVTGTFFDIVAADSGQTEATVRAGASADQVTANDAASNAYDAIVRLTKASDAELIATDTKNLRHYTFEEQADDMSQVVLFALSEDFHGIITFLQQGALTDAGRAECTGFGTTEPPYGILSDPHHGTCWRIWHSTTIATAMAAGH